MHTSPKNKFHKLLFSATLTRDPQHLASLSLRNPLFFSAATDKRYVVPPRLTVKIIIIKLLERSFFFFEEGLYQWKLLVLLYAEREQLYIIIFKGTSCGVQRLGEASGFGAFAAHGPSQTYYLFHCVCGFDAQVFFFFYCYFIFSNYFVLPPEACFCKKKNRLFRLLELCGEFPGVAEYSSSLSQSQRSRLIADFRSGSIPMFNIFVYYYYYF